MIEWARPYSAWLYVVVGLGLLALVFVARHTAISPQLRRWLLFVPRCGVWGALLVVLLNPVRRHEQGLPDQPALVHFLVDGSRSMALDRPQSRAAAVQRVLEAAEQQFHHRPQRPRVQWYRFGSQLSAATDSQQLAPRDDASRLGEALGSLTERFSRDIPRALVVFSDGAVDDAGELEAAAHVYRDLGIPIHVYPVGDAQLRGDVAIRDLVLPPRVTAGAKVPVRGVVRGRGYDGQRVVVQVRSVDRPAVPPVATLPLTLTGEAQPFELVVEAQPDLGELLLEVSPLEGEISVRNNRVPFRLIQTPRKIRVLYLEGTAGEEYRWIRDALQEDKDLECLSMVADQQYVQRPRLVRVGDPFRGYPATREELLQYDCVICSDISRGAFTREQLDWTVELVSQRGGGFAMVGGITSFGAGGWDQTAWDQLIPIDMAGGALGRGWVYHNFQVRVPVEVEQHPVWRIVEDPAENRRILDRMPPFLGTNYMQRLKPAATALAYSKQEIPGAGIMPIFAAQAYGRGRTFAFAPDSTADWGRYFESQWGEGDNRYFRRFWRNVVRWLTENSQAGAKRVRAETDRVVYRLGEPVELTALAFDEQQKETTRYELFARLAADPQEAVPAGPGPTVAGTPSGVSFPLTVQTDGGGYAATIDSQQLAGVVDFQDADAAVALTRKLEIVATDQGQEIGRTNVTLQLLPDSRELDQPQALPRTLEQLADQSGGQVLHSPEELVGTLSALPIQKGDVIVNRAPLWDHPLLWGAILALLTVEWSLRRRAGYG
ncbi:MAG: glutamine amidotransferase [Pirellulales bacterium]